MLNHPERNEKICEICEKSSHLQHDLKGRMPERSEWLLAEGVAKRNPRYNLARRDAKNANISFLGDNIRVIQTLFF